LRSVRRPILAGIAVILLFWILKTSRLFGKLGKLGGRDVAPRLTGVILNLLSFSHDPMESGNALVRTPYKFVSFDALLGHVPFFG
jgi:hypothetical protein